MTDELEKHVLKKYDIAQKLGKGVRASSRVERRGRAEAAACVVDGP